MVPKLTAAHLSVEYYIPRDKNHLVALEDINFTVEPGEIVSLLGPSGCGKTTFLLAVDGLVRPTRGSIHVDGRVVSGPGRDRALVFQSPALLPWRTVVGNVTYGLELQGVEKRLARERALEFIHLVGLDGFEERYSHQLSGGMQQRVNLARALASDPQLLLLDEPFASLDAQTRELMQAELARILAATGKTAVAVTHDIGEAVYLSDRVAVLTPRPGRIKQIVEIDLPRPRPLKLKRQPEMLRYEEQLWDLLQEERN